MPYAPEYTATGVDFVVPIGNSGLSVIARLDASFTGETWFSAVQDGSVVTEFGLPGDYSKTSRDAFTAVKRTPGTYRREMGSDGVGTQPHRRGIPAEVIPAPEFGGTFSHDDPRVPD